MKLKKTQNRENDDELDILEILRLNDEDAPEKHLN